MLHKAEEKALRKHAIKDLKEVRESWEAIEAAHVARLMRQAASEGEDDEEDEEDDGDDEDGGSDDTGLPVGVTSEQAHKVMIAGYRLRRVLAPSLMDVDMVRGVMNTIELGVAVETGRQVRRAVDELEGLGASLPTMGAMQIMQLLGTKLDKMQKQVQRTATQSALL